MSFSRKFITGCAELGIFNPNNTIPNPENVPEISSENYMAFLNQTRNPIATTVSGRLTTRIPLLDTIASAAAGKVFFNQPPVGTNLVSCCAESEPNFDFSLARADQPHTLTNRVSIIVQQDGEPKLFFKNFGDVNALMLTNDFAKGLVIGAFGVIKSIAYVTRREKESPRCITIPLSVINRVYPIRMSTYSLPEEVKESLSENDPSASFF